MKTGEIWQLGSHLLLIGDCTDPTYIHHLIEANNGVMANTAILDPPFGLIRASWDIKGNTTFPTVLPLICDPKGSYAIFCSLPYGFLLHHAMLSAGYRWRFDLAITRKNGSIRTSRKLPIKCHEYIFCYCSAAAGPAQLTFNGYEAGEVKEAWSTRTASWSNSVYGLTHNLRRGGREDGKRWVRSVLQTLKKQEMPLAERTKHPSQKSLKLVSTLVELLSNPGDTVYDGFAGSGTTILACESLGRRCLAIEQDLESAEMIIERWQTMTKQPIQRLG
jgi:DNA modification methylase